MGRATWPLKIGSLVLHAPPLRVGVADELLEEVLRRKNSWDVLRKRHEWLVVIGVDQAFPEAAKHHDPQNASRVDEMTAQILFDFEFCLALAADRRSAFSLIRVSARAHIIRRAAWTRRA